MKLLGAITLAIAFSCPLIAQATDQGDPMELARVEVTSDKIPTTLARSPDTVSVVDGETLRAQGATDLGSAMRLVAGAEAAPVGDNGPASSAPAFWGLREFDAFLLVIDGVPSGGAFNPALQALDMSNVERVEVLRGAAPVSFGATSFVGVIKVIHYAAGSGPLRAEVHVGDHGSYGVVASVPLSPGTDGGFASSLLVNASRLGVAADRTGFDRWHALYRARGRAGEGTLGLDVDASVVNQNPGSPHPLEDGALSPRFRLNANVNPSDARLDETRLQLALDYSQDTALGAWNSKLSLARTLGQNTRGFLRAHFADDGITHNADGFRQHRHTDELYFDTHVVTPLSARTTVAWGVDALYGNGTQSSSNFEYGVLPDGSNAPDSRSLDTDERTYLNDRRSFTGIYGDWRFDVSKAWRIDVGVRYNHTTEQRFGQRTDLTGNVPTAEQQSSHRANNRWSGALGTSVQLWKKGSDELDVYANYRSTFKPAAIDFGPDVEGGILLPETARSGEVGLKGSNLRGRLQWDASVFLMRFDHLVVTQDVDGLPGLVNGGSERFRGAEFEARYRLSDALAAQGSYAWHDARFADDTQLFDRGQLQLRGNQIELSPHQLAGLGLTWCPAHGLTGYAIASYVGSRFLDKPNAVPANGYTSLDGGMGYRRDAWEARVDATNLTNRRDAVAKSEFGKSQYYRLPGRSVTISLRWTFH